MMTDTFNGNSDAFIGTVNDNSWADGSTWDYTKWKSGEPNNNSNPGGGTQDCGVLRKHSDSGNNNVWLDVDCHLSKKSTFCMKG